MGIANFGGPFTYNLLGEIILIINLRIFRFSILIFISFISFFSAAYRLVLYSNLQQGLNNNLFFNINNLSTSQGKRTDFQQGSEQSQVSQLVPLQWTRAEEDCGSRGVCGRQRCGSHHQERPEPAQARKQSHARRTEERRS